MSEEKTHIVPYKTQILVLIALLVLTAVSVAVTQLEFGSYNTLAAMLLAGTKSLIVMAWFMHLKYEKKLLPLMVAGVLVILLLVLFVTFFDYSYR
ncbi:MAG: cytochrome C oxidase subunit IV family protein [Bacteroidales bacterium]|nr:cytochrome C oxidase subunit IV family protein [Bacteroidales bacterium]